MPIVRLAVAVLLLAAILASAFAGAASAAIPLDNRDTRARDSGPVAAETRRARNTLEQGLGDEGTVTTDRITGAARLVARTDGFLTARSTHDAAKVALDYVRAREPVFGLDEGDLDALRLTSRYRSPIGATHLAYTQTYLGVAAYDNVLLANLDEDGRLLNVGGAAVPDLRVASITPGVDAAAALAVAKQEVGGAMIPPRAREGRGAERPTRFANGDAARLTLFNDGSTTRLAWRLQVTGEARFLYDVVVDAANGEVLKRRSLTEFAAAQVYKNFPGAPRGGTAETVDLTADPTWLNRSQQTIPRSLRGNNAWAFADADAIDGPSDGDFDIPPSSGTDWNYPIVTFGVAGQTCPPPGCTWNSSDPATRATNRNQTTTQLFYLVNRFHDHLKADPIGFTHAARGFEFTDADGAGPGVGGDPLLAETDNYLNPDNSQNPPLPTSTNNASMSTPSDGESPWLQTFFFKNPSLNASDTADVVYHEYTHGLTNRSVGSGMGLAADQSRALGEGWSDWYALDLLVAEGQVVDNPDADGELQIGAYLLPGGFRWQGVDCPLGSSAAGCPATGAAGRGGFTLGDMSRIASRFEVHDVGEIWAQTLWDLRRALASTPGVARALVTGGLRLAPDNPSFLEARDAIIQADQALGGTNYETLWRLFAARGMGYSAATASAAATTAQEAFDLPPELRVQITAPGTTPASPPAPAPAPAQAPAPPAPPSALALAPAKLEVLRAGVRSGRLDVLARVTARATGRVTVGYRSSGRMTRFTVPIVRGSIDIDRRLPASQRAKPTGIFTLTYPGSTTVQPDSVTLRAAPGKALLVRRTTRIDTSGRLYVAGTITSRARGVVRVRLGYTMPDGSAELLSYKATIRRGGWSLTTPPLPPAARGGGQLSIQFTGYEPLRIRGEQLAKAVSP